MLNIPDFNLFLYKNCNPLLIKVTPSKISDPVKHPLYENKVGSSTPPAERRGAGAHYDSSRLAKKTYLEDSETLFERQKYNQKPNPRFQAVILIGQIYIIPKYQKGN